MGSTPVSIARIFVYKGLAIGTIGVVAGWLISLAAGFAQNYWKIVSLPPDIYFITHVPIDSHLFDYLIAGGVTFVICFLAALIPAAQAARLSVVDVLRH
jgi:lipoprotein-releasing system permease protein